MTDTQTTGTQTTGTVLEVTGETFGPLVSSLSPGRAVLVDFWAQWCGYCRMLFPVLDELATELGDRLTIVKVNVDENQVIAQRYGVLALPTLIVVRDGEVISRFVGARSKRRLLADLGALL